MDTALPSKKKKRSAGWLALPLFLFLGLGGVAAASGGGSKKKKPDSKPADPKPGPEPEPEPESEPESEPAPEPDPPPQAPPPGEALSFDLSSNWGATPWELRKHLARMELASGIPGSARAVAVKFWQAYRAGQALVSPAEAAEIAAKNPDLCRTCLNLNDGPDAKTGIAKGIENGWPVPKDKSGWEAGSYGLGDVLGSTAVWTGIEDAKTGAKTYSRALLPLIELPAKAAMQRFDVQVWVVGTQIWQFLNGKNYKVLVPGKEVTNGDSFNTWGNIFSAYASPSAFVQGQGLDAKTRYLQRATELGIDLTKVDFPWPPGKAYKYGTHFAPVKKFWALLQDYMQRDVVDIGANNNAPPQQQQQPKLPAPANLLIGLPRGLSYRGLATPVPPTKAAPMVLVLHGRDADDLQVEPLVPQGLEARVFLIRGGLKGTEGWRYFNPQLTTADAAAAITAATPGLVAALQHLVGQHPTTRVLAIGYSQGGALALRLAALGAVDGAVSICGMLPATLLPSWSNQARISMVHGGKDLAVPLAKAQETYQGFAKAGFVAQLQALDQGGHALTSQNITAGSVALETLLGEVGDVDAQGWHFTESCELVIDDLPAMQRTAVPQLVDKATEYKGELSETILIDLVRAVLAADDLGCLLGSFTPLSAEHARAQYLFARALLQTLVLRGRMAKEKAAVFLQDTRQSAIKAGAAAANLPPMEV